MGEVIKPDIWDLQADTGYLSQARARWNRLATNLGRQADNLASRKTELEQDWEAPMATSYFGHSDRLQSALTDASGHCDRVVTALDGLADDVTDAQSRLDASLQRAGRQAKSVVRSDGMVTFTPWDDDDTLPEVDTEYGVAEGIIDEVIAEVSGRSRDIGAAGSDARSIKTTWDAAADGSDPGWDVPTGRTYDVQVTTLGTTTVVNTGDGADDITVWVDPDTGETVITIDSPSGTEEVRIPAGEQVVINTGRGNDTITVEEGTDVRLRFATGIGDDTIDSRASDGAIEAFTGQGDDTVEAGAGNDYISTGAGDDYVDAGAGNDRVFGGHGNDVLYGMDGEDVISGGDGNDYLEGGNDDDTIFGGAGRDVVSGGFGDDHLFGGSGNDTIYAGAGTDTIDGQGGLRDEIFAEAHDSAPGGERVVIVEIPPEEEYLRWLEFEVGGTPEFQARVLADLQMMASSPTGQTMLDQMGQHYDNSGFLGIGKQKVTISQHAGGNNSAGYGGSEGYRVKLDPTHLSRGYNMGYTGAGDYDITPPVVFFFHELGHINQYRTGEHEQFKDSSDPEGKARYSDGTPLIERQNVGLVWDHDGDPNTPEVIDPDYEFVFTENAFRDELGLPTRRKY